MVHPKKFLYDRNYIIDEHLNMINWYAVIAGLKQKELNRLYDKLRVPSFHDARSLKELLLRKNITI